MKSRSKLLDLEKKIKTLSPEEIEQYGVRKKQMEYQLPENELSGNLAPSDEKGIISNTNSVEEI